MGAHIRFLPTGNRLFAGKLAGRGLLPLSAASQGDAPSGSTDAPGLFSSILRGRLGHAPTGARAAATTHDEPLRAPTLVADNTATFHCPLWPGCGCPGGTMRPECPGLKARVGVE